MTSLILAAFFAASSLPPSYFTHSVFIAPVAAQSERRCYFRDGTVANDHVPCSKFGGFNCCHKTDVCLSNGLCYDPLEGLNYRGGCTIREWTEDYCSQICSTGEFIRSSSFPDQSQHDRRHFIFYLLIYCLPLGGRTQKWHMAEIIHSLFSCLSLHLKALGSLYFLAHYLSVSLVHLSFAANINRVGFPFTTT